MKKVIVDENTPKLLVEFNENQLAHERLLKYVEDNVREELKDENAETAFIGTFILPDLKPARDYEGNPNMVIVEFRTEDDQTEPHLYIHNEYFRTAVRIDKADYYYRNNRYLMKFTNDQYKAFNKFMKSEFNDKLTNWQYTVLLYNSCYSIEKKKITVMDCPNYCLL